MEWIFQKASPETRTYGSQASHSFKWDASTLAREAIQNSLDARRAENEPVGVEFRLMDIDGEILDRFLDALCWDSSGNGALGLREHLAAAAADKRQKFGKSVSAALDRMGQRPSSLRLLRIDDWGTKGLVGLESEPGPFMALCRNILDTDKEDDTSGGSFGLGKSVLWHASDISTVLFFSDLDPLAASRYGNRQTRGRLIGKSELAWHRLESAKFSGPGWFGVEAVEDSTTMAISRWNSELQAAALLLDRSIRPAELEDLPNSGTSILVVAFNDPGSNVDRMHIEDAAAALREAIASNFWPALVSESLRAVVTTWRNGEQIDSTTVDPIDSDAAPFVRALQALEALDIAGSKEEFASSPGSLYLHNIPLTVPAKVKGEDQHSQLTHTAQLVIRHLRSDDPTAYSGTVIFYRGNEMVIRKRPVKLPGSISFVAMVLCGRAAGDAAGGREAERFLRAAEPPAHDNWEATDEVRAEYQRGNRYKQGYTRSLSDFFAECERVIREVCRPASPKTGDGPESLKRLFRFGSMPSPPVNVPEMRAREWEIRNGSWVVSGEIVVPAGSGWRVKPVLKFRGESGAGVPVLWESLDVDPPGAVRWEGQELEVDIQPLDRRTPIRFVGVSNAETHPVEAGSSVAEVVIVTLNQGRSA